MNEQHNPYPQDPEEIVRFAQEQDALVARTPYPIQFEHHNWPLSDSSAHGIKLYNDEQEMRAQNIWMCFGYIDGIQIATSGTSKYLFYRLSEPNEKEVEDIRNYVLYDKKDWM